MDFTRRAFLIGSGVAVAAIAAAPAAAALDATRRTLPEILHTVLVVDGDGTSHLVGSYLGDPEAAADEAIDMLAEELATEDPDEHDDLVIEIWKDDVKAVQVWLGYHAAVPAEAPVYEDGHLDPMPAIGATVDVGGGVLGRVVAPFDCPAGGARTAYITVPSGALGRRLAGRIMLRPAPWGQMAIAET